MHLICLNVLFIDKKILKRVKRKDFTYKNNIPG